MDLQANYSTTKFPDNLIAMFLQLNKDLATLHQYSTDDFMPVNKIFKNYYDRSKTVSPVEQVHPEAGDYKAVIGRIITDLQFHDIIRQKIEHIEAINGRLIDELSRRGKDASYPSEYIGVIPEISNVNIAQLQLISDEYQSTIIRLRIDLENMEDYIARVSSVSLNLSNSFTQSANFNKLYQDSVKMLNQISSLVPKDEKVTEENRVKAMMSLGALYTMQSERAVFSKIFTIPDHMAVQGNSAASEEDIEFF